MQGQRLLRPRSRCTASKHGYLLVTRQARDQQHAPRCKLLYLIEGVVLNLWLIEMQLGDHACICCPLQSCCLLLTHVGLVDMLLE